jgi:hypothetical protein
VATDGAPSTTGKNKGFIERLRKKANENFEHTFHRKHCIITSRDVMHKSY